MFGRRKPLVARDGLVVGAKDSLHGTVHARDVTVAGRVDGALEVAGTLLVTDTGHVCGTLHAAQLTVHAGAVVRAAVRGGPVAASDGVDAKPETPPAPDRSVLQLTPRDARRAAGGSGDA